jgi:hypothetical protein
MHKWTCLLKQQSSITIHRLPTKETKPRETEVAVFLIVPFSIYTSIYICIYIYIETTAHIYCIYGKLNYIYTYMLPLQMEDGKRKPRRFSLIRLPSFVRWLMKKQTEVIHLKQTKRIKRTKRTKWIKKNCPTMSA